MITHDKDWKLYEIPILGSNICATFPGIDTDV